MSRGMKNIPQSQPQKIEFEGLDWTEQYCCFRTYIDNWLELNFWYSDEQNYKISVAGRELATSASNPAEGARLAVKAAKVWCERVVKKLDEVKEIKIDN